MQFKLHKYAKLIQLGAIIAYPTEAVYGLGCNPMNPNAIMRLLAIKQRPVHKGLILIASHISQLNPYVTWQPEWLQKVQASWPGPYTWLLPAKDNLPTWINGGKPTVACRVTAHPMAAALCHATKSALISTSANRSGKKPAKSAWQVKRHCPGVDAIFHGSIGKLSKPTHIKNVLTGEQIR